MSPCFTSINRIALISLRPQQQLGCQNQSNCTHAPNTKIADFWSGIKQLSPLEQKTNRFDFHFIVLKPTQPFPDCSFCKVSALRLWTRAFMSWCEVTMAWDIESAKFTSLTIVSSQINDVTIMTTARFKLHESLFVQAREKQATRRKYFSQLLIWSWIQFNN